ncbi:Isochorismate synthase 2 chloroplastic [Bienertia sinuspersici]
MIHWSRTVVRPVVDDTIFGGARPERLAERWALAVCFGALSWWRLRDEVESLVVVVEVKRDMMMKVGLGDFLGLWLYYLTVAIGMARIIKAIMWLCMTLFSRSPTNDQEDNSSIELIIGNEDKV